MVKVSVLPEVLAHQIAAGEVVERPASVVKELVENSLDASAQTIRVQLEEGGKRRIRVTDDGHGMGREDAMLAFEHHATSKIREFQDLLDIRTLGFRGEALPSIASISRTTLRTTEKSGDEDPLGTEIRYQGGKLEEVAEIAWPAGTEVSVDDLFFNVPARRKFLKTVATELSHVSRLVTCYALAYPEVEFRLEHHDRELIQAVATREHSERIYQLLGMEMGERLVPLDYERDQARISGFCSLPHEQRSNANSLYLFVNRRMVKDRVLTHALRQAYRDLIPSSAYPVAVLFVEVSPSLIDVNVHPTKVEIRFRDSQKIHSAIVHAVEQGLLLHRTNLSNIARSIPLGQRPFEEEAGEPAAGVRRSLHSFFSRSPHDSLPFHSGRRFHSGSGFPASSGSPRAPIHSGVIGGLGEPAHGNAIPETDHLSDSPVVMGQFVESFVVAADRNGVMLVDQHVAHERILYDRALKAMHTDREVPSQRLLMPATLELTPQQKALADRVLEGLNENGFEVEWFGASSLLVRSVPALAKELDPAAVVEGLLEDLEHLDEVRQRSDGTGRSLQRLQEKIAISLSCRAAIKINTPLSPDKMIWLLDELFRCENPYTCPHGRPVILRLDLPEILKGFKRI